MEVPHDPCRFARHLCKVNVFSCNTFVFLTGEKVGRENFVGFELWKVFVTASHL